MTKCLIQGVYTDAAAEGLAREGGSSRREVITGVVEALGGKLLAPIYYGFGERVDVFALGELPDNASVAAVTLMAAPGGVICKTTILMDPGEIDDAVSKSPSYRPPGH